METNSKHENAHSNSPKVAKPGAAASPTACQVLLSD